MRLAHFIQTTSLLPPSTVLVIGADQESTLKELTEQGFKPVGIASDEKGVVGNRENGFESYQMDPSFFDFENECLSAIVIGYSLESSSAPPLNPQECHRVLKQGGSIYLEVAVSLPGKPESLQKNKDWNVETLKEQMAPFGFEVLDCKMKISDEAKNEAFAFLICRKNTSITASEPPALQFQRKISKESPPPQRTLHLGLPSGSNYGWGLCGSYLRKELAPQISLTNPTLWYPPRWKEKVRGTCFHALEGSNLKPWISLQGDQTIGYVFFENDLNDEARSHAGNLDLVLAGSTWCRERMTEKGILNTDVLLQGIDPELFYPLDSKPDSDDFVLFSGGKFELRKGQDLVLAAFRVLSLKYPHFRLINAWENQWEASMKTMTLSSHIEYVELGQTWLEKMHALYVRNGIDPQKVHTCPLLSNRKMRAIYAKTDLGVFPNRCEGGTNLVLMEYMACGRPVVASFSSGHRDILTSDNAFMVKTLKPMEVKDGSGKFSAHWDEPDLEELIAQIEGAYLNREKRKKIGFQAGNDLKNLTWNRMAERVLNFIL